MGALIHIVLRMHVICNAWDMCVVRYEDIQGKTVSSSSSTITGLTGGCWSISFLTVSFLDLPSGLWLAALTQPLTYPSHGGKGDDLPSVRLIYCTLVSADAEGIWSAVK